MEIIAATRPRLAILTSVDLDSFLERFGTAAGKRTPQLRDGGVKQVVFESAIARLRGCTADSVVVRVAHASQFSWTYSKEYGGRTVLDRIKEAVGA